MQPEQVQGAARLAEVRFAVAVAAGRQPGTVLLQNAQVVNVCTGEIVRTHVLLAGRLIAGVGEAFATAGAEQVVDLSGRWLVPGLIDGHVHLESALVTPAEYARAVLPRGVTAVVCDPHEIGNVAGLPGIQWLLQASAGLPMDVWVTVPSCVPATPLETAGAELGLAEMAALLDQPRVLGVAEIMNFPGVIAGDDRILARALLAERYGKVPDGHAPLLSGRALHAYLAAGIGSDHECTGTAEGLEKLRAGCFLMIREGSATRNLTALAPLITPRHTGRIGFVTDDRFPHDLLSAGGVDDLVRRAIALGVDPALAVQCATCNTARYFRLPRRGAVAPGYVADLAVLDDLAAFTVATVYKNGAPVATDGRLAVELPAAPPPTPAVTGTVRLPPLGPADLRLAAPAGEIRCLRLVPGQILTEQVWVQPRTEAGQVVADPERDLAKLVCVERHGRRGGVGVGLVTGLGLRAGAIASTVAHDHHNLMAAGTNDADLLAAARRLAELGGGFVAVAGGRVLAELPLPIAGLVTDQPLEQVRAALDRLEAAAGQLGVQIPAPFMALSFLGLAVIPELRLTDRGLVDVAAARLVPPGRLSAGG